MGFASESGVAADGDSDIALIPLVSGYRRDDTKELVLTTHYATALDMCLQDKLPGLKLDDFQVVLPRAEIASARAFNTQAYKVFVDTHSQLSGGTHVSSDRACI